MNHAAPPSPQQKYFTRAEVAARLGYSIATIKRLFQNEPDTLHLIGPGVVLGTAKHIHDTLRIPESGIVRVLAKLIVPRPL